jgi:hypothetical protein
MNLEPHQIQLTPDQQSELASVSAAAGKPWPVVFHEALAAYRGETAVKSNGNSGQESFLEAASRLGLWGCLRGGPCDLSSNPAYMKGFGQSDG